MLSKARSSNSSSLLREMEDALVLIKNDEDREYFLNKILDTFTKKNNPDIFHTGEKDLKTELLAYFKQKAYVRTANIWARNIPMDREAINELLALLQQRLLENNIQGILELHLQDREINSPHIQFVGIKAELAERIIAQVLVDFKYEISLESALGKKDFIPYYEQNSKARVQELETMLEYKERKKKQEKIIDEKEIDELMQKFDLELKNLEKTLNKIKSNRQNFMKKIEVKFQDYRQDLAKKRRKLKIIRMKRKRR